jgi:xanthine permease XanP
MLPPAARVALGTSLVLGTLVGLGLNLLFRIGLRKTGSLTVQPGVMDPAALGQFMEERGASWGARRDVIERAKFNLEQSIETIASSGVAAGPLEVEASFDEFNLDVRVSYDGPPLMLPERRPTNEEIIASEEGERKLAGFMLRRYADRVASAQKGDRSTILFHFDH